MVNIGAYHRQIVLYKNYLVNLEVFSIHNISEQVMEESVRETLLKVTGVISIEDTFFTENVEKWFAVTSKPCKEQTKREVNRILEGIVFKIIHPDYINQPGTISKANRSPRITSYAVVLQQEVEFGPNAQNIHLPPTGSNRQLKRNVVALYDTKIKILPHVTTRKENQRSDQNQQ